MSETTTTAPAGEPAPSATPGAAVSAVDSAPLNGGNDAGAGAVPTTAAPAAPAEPTTTETKPAESSVIGEALKPTETTEPAKAAEPAPGEKETVEGQSEEPAPPPTYEPFALPEGFQADPEQMGAFTSMLGDFETTTKADHAAVQAFGQKLVEQHVADMQRTAQAVAEHYANAEAERRTAWKDAFLADPEIGGNRFQTTVDAALKFIRAHGGTDEQQAEFRKAMDETGAGNHPAVIRLLALAGKAMAEPSPLAAPMPASEKSPSRVERMYGRTSG